MQAEFQTATAQVEIVTKSLQSTRQRLDQLQASLAQAEARMSDNSRRIEELDAARQQRNRDCLSAQVELARSEQQLDHLRGQLRRYEQDRHERDRTIAEAREHMTESDHASPGSGTSYFGRRIGISGTISDARSAGD